MSDATVACFDGVTHYHGATRALHALSLEIPRGGVFALLGRNGAGKTTAIRCLLGLLAPSRGRISVLGEDASSLPFAVRDRIGYVAEGQPLVPWMTVGEAASFQAATFPSFDRKLCDDHLARLDLPLDRRIKNLSRGQRAQVALSLSLSLAARPELVVLDDPAMGLDAVVRREFLEAMIDLIGDEGRTVLFSSHVLADVERVADRVAILDRGVLRANAPLDVLKERVRRLHGVFPDAAPEAPALPGIVRSTRRRNELLLTVAAGHDAAEARVRELGARHVEWETLPLEDLFIEYTSASGGAA